MTKTLEEMIAVMQAAAEGKPIECKYTDLYNQDQWLTVVEPTWNWDLYDYRVAVRPEPGETPDSIDWSQLDERWRYMARDGYGTVNIYTHRPSWSGSDLEIWYNRAGPADRDRCRVDNMLTSYRRGTVPAERSLIERPGDVPTE